MDRIINYKRQPLVLYFVRRIWELSRKCSFIVWSDEELVKAENHPDGFIGMKYGINCYLIKYFPERKTR